MSFEQKYLKYKNKYLNLKDQFGGAKIRCKKCHIEYDPEAGETCICDKLKAGADGAKAYFDSLKIGQKFHLLNKEKKDIEGRYIEIISKVKMDLSSLGAEYYPNLLCKINYVTEDGRVYKDAHATLTFGIGINPWSGIGMLSDPFGTIVVHANNPDIDMLIPNMILGSEIK
jgi:hypothetical protein